MTNMKDKQTMAIVPQKKTYEAPALRREAQMPIITAGSFDLLIPNA